MFDNDGKVTVTLLPTIVTDDSASTIVFVFLCHTSTSTVPPA
jgi:hypothetical protein